MGSTQLLIALGYILLRVKNRRRSFAYLLPIAVLLAWAIIVVIPGLLFFIRLKQMAHGSGSVSLGSGELVFTIPADRFFVVAFDRVGWAGKALMMFNTPARFLDAFISLVLVRVGIPLWPQSLDQSTWHAVIYPFYALPAWIYIGFGIDAFVGLRNIRIWHMILSLVLVLTCASLFCGFAFGLNAAERSQEISWFIDGLAIWTVLFSIPVAAWARQSNRRTLNDEPLPSWLAINLRILSTSTPARYRRVEQTVFRRRTCDKGIWTEPLAFAADAGFAMGPQAAPFGVGSLGDPCLIDQAYFLPVSWSI